METENGKTFPMEINFLGTVLEVKRTINLKKAIPTSHQVQAFLDILGRIGRNAMPNNSLFSCSVIKGS